ncbi:MAG TPA: ATP phosphoribosyltransferase regulatory subunit [Stellaceae bacterium]|jgi:ATP phosphoribosyltransferase regulatory subunit|nr:ATP phosphoribosyltransferase regulatory subunit [Stellaceae bacterium]
MNETLHRALLPQGLRDLLPPDAAVEAEMVDRQMAVLASHGYERVKPPLVEFEDNLLAGAGAAMAPETFRLMDPISQRMVGIRADMTPQVARIANSRLQKAPRPLRLCYAGQVLRVKGSEIRPERQVGQVGAELIGSDALAADAEVVTLAAAALAASGVEGISVDLTLPTLVPALGAALGLSGRASEALRQALDHKDVAGVAEAGGKAAPLLVKLVGAAGSVKKAVAALQAIALPEAVAAERERLLAVVEAVQRAAPDLTLTLDPVENRGFEYHTGVSFALFARGVRGELGRGGRYRTGNGEGEPATGFTLYTDTVLRAVPKPRPQPRLYLPLGSDPALAARLRGEGWATVAGLAAVTDAAAEAQRLGCGHWLKDREIVAIL